MKKLLGFFLLIVFGSNVHAQVKTMETDKKLESARIALLIADGFEQVEMTEPKRALEEAGAKVDIISPSKGIVRGWKSNNWGDGFPVDVELSHSHPEKYDALVLPGGVMNPDHLRIVPRAIAFVTHFIDANKPIAAICHGPWTLINANAVEGKTMTSWPSLQADLTNAGANWVNKEVVIDGNLITSRKPADIPAFNKAMVEVFSRSINENE